MSRNQCILKQYMEKENIITIDALAATGGLRVVTGKHLAAIWNGMVREASDEGNNVYIDTIDAGGPLEVVEKCREYVEGGFKGVLYTNNPVAVEALSVHSRANGVETKLYLTVDDGSLEDVSDNHEKFYRTVTAAYDAIDTVATREL